jgi:hypothetical protein
LIVCLLHDWFCEDRSSSCALKLHNGMGLDFSAAAAAAVRIFHFSLPGN